VRTDRHSVDITGRCRLVWFYLLLILCFLLIFGLGTYLDYRRGSRPGPTEK
jgi:hypothetical protein